MVAEQPVACPTCRKPALADYPHRHDTPVRPDYDPMPTRPSSPAAMLLIMRAEYLAEIPRHLHVGYVPSRAEPVTLDDRIADLLDTGPLGSPSWSPPFHRYIGAAEFWEGEMVLADAELAPFPWTRQLEGVRRWCAAKHRAWDDHDGPLCWSLLVDLLHGYPLPHVADAHGVELDQARELAGTALGKWWAWTSNDLNGLDLRRRPGATIARAS